MRLPGLHDRRVHVEHDVLCGIGAMAGLMAAGGSAPVFGELPDPTTLVRTGCRQLRALVATSRVPEEISCPSCREHGWAIYQERALDLEAAGHAERTSSPSGRRRRGSHRVVSVPSRWPGWRRNGRAARRMLSLLLLAPGLDDILA